MNKNLNNQVYCTECEFLTHKSANLYSCRNDEWYISGIEVLNICSKHNERIVCLYSNVYIPCKKCDGKDFKFYTCDSKRLKPNIHIIKK